MRDRILVAHERDSAVAIDDAVATEDLVLLAEGISARAQDGDWWEEEKVAFGRQKVEEFKSRAIFVKPAQEEAAYVLSPKRKNITTEDRTRNLSRVKRTS